MTTRTKNTPPTLVHDTDVRRIGPGAYRAECAADGWHGELHEGNWWTSRAAAIADADEHAGREPRPAPKGPTPSRPVRIGDDLWSPVLEVAEAEGTTASAILREALAADPRIAARRATALAS